MQRYAGEIVRAGQVAAGLRRFQARGERPDRVGAGVDQDLGVQPQQAAAPVGVGGQAIVVLARVGAGDEMFAPVLDPAERRLAGQRQPGDADILGLQQALVAEAAADIGWRDADGRLRNVQHLGEAGTDQVRHLGGGVHDKLRGAMVPPAQQAAALHRMHHLTGAAQGKIDFYRRAGGDRVDAAVERGFQEQVVGPVFVQARGTWGAAGGAAGDRGEFGVVDLDAFGQVLGGGAGGGDAHRHRFANETHALGGEGVEFG